MTNLSIGNLPVELPKLDSIQKSIYLECGYIQFLNYLPKMNNFKEVFLFKLSFIEDEKSSCEIFFSLVGTYNYEKFIFEKDLNPIFNGFISGNPNVAELTLVDSSSKTNGKVNLVNDVCLYLKIS